MKQREEAGLSFLVAFSLVLGVAAAPYGWQPTNALDAAADDYRSSAIYTSDDAAFRVSAGGAEVSAKAGDGTGFNLLKGVKVEATGSAMEIAGDSLSSTGGLVRADAGLVSQGDVTVTKTRVEAAGLEVGSGETELVDGRADFGYDRDERINAAPTDGAPFLAGVGTVQVKDGALALRNGKYNLAQNVFKGVIGGSQANPAKMTIADGARVQMDALSSIYVGTNAGSYAELEVKNATLEFGKDTLGDMTSAFVTYPTTGLGTLTLGGFSGVGSLRIGEGALVNLRGLKVSVGRATSSDRNHKCQGNYLFDGGVVRGLDNIFAVGDYAASTNNVVFGGTRFIDSGLEASVRSHVFSAQRNYVTITNGDFFSDNNNHGMLRGTRTIFRQTGGLFGCGKQSITYHDQDHTETDVYLEGGIMRVPFVGKGISNKPCRYHLDGGRWSVDRESASNVKYAFGGKDYKCFLYGLDLAELGERGFTVEMDWDAVLDQDFTDKAGVAAGPLCLDGRGDKHLAATSHESRLDLIGGRTIVEATAAHESARVTVTNGATLSMSGSAAATTFAALTLGDAATYGTLEADAGDLVTVTGDLVLGKAAVALTAPLTAGTHDILRVKGSVAGDWAKTVLAAGTADGVAASFTSRTDGSDTVLSVTGTSDAGATAAYTLTTGGLDFTGDGTENAVGLSVNGAVGEKTGAAVPGKAELTFAKDASLTLRDFKAGRLVKKGSGKLTLKGNSALSAGFELDGGKLEIDGVAAAGTRGSMRNTIRKGTVSMTGDPDRDTWMPMAFDLQATETAAGATYTMPAVFKVNTDVTTYPPISFHTVTGGNLVKYGKGRWTWHGYSWLINSLNPVIRPPSNRDAGDLSFDDANGTVSGGFANLTVAEGDLYLLGGRYNGTLDSDYIIGRGGYQVEADPRLIVDGANGATAQMGNFTVGLNISAGNSNIVSPALVLTNYAYVGTSYGCGITFGSGCDRSVMPRLEMSDSILKCGALSFCGGKNTVRAKNSHIRIAGQSFGVSAEADMRFDNTTLRGNNKNLARNVDLPLNIMFQKGGTLYPPDGGTFEFCNGSEICLSKVYLGASCRDYTRLNVFAFDDASLVRTYDTSGTYEFTVNYLANGNSDCTNVEFRVKAGGITVPVYGEATVNMNLQLVGEGGLRKTGSGTLAFVERREYDTGGSNPRIPADCRTLAYDGATEIYGGTVVIVTNAAVRAGADFTLCVGTVLDLNEQTCELGTVGGAGLVKNGTLVNPVIDLTPFGGDIPDTLTFENVTLVNPMFKMTVTDDGLVPGTFALDGVTISGSGKILFDLGRDAEHALQGRLSAKKDMPVGTYANGATPDVSGWKVTGGGRAMCGTFVAEDGTVRLSLANKPGLLLLLK